MGDYDCGVRIGSLATLRFKDRVVHWSVPIYRHQGRFDVRVRLIEGDKAVLDTSWQKDSTMRRTHFSTHFKRVVGFLGAEHESAITHAINIIYDGHATI